jgi:hypothetical protein
MRRNRRNNMMGGAYNPMNLSLAQGQEFDEIHTRQHGGGMPLTGAPVGDQGLLPNDLRDIARLTPLDGKLSEIAGLRDPDQVAVAAPQAGGGKRRRSRRNGWGLNVTSLFRNNAANSGLNQINTSLLTNAPAAPAPPGERKNRKASRKNRKASRKNRKASRKASRKNSMRRGRRTNMNMMGGAYPGDGSPLSSPNMLLTPSQAAKAGTADFSNPWLRD